MIFLKPSHCYAITLGQRQNSPAPKRRRQIVPFRSHLCEAYLGEENITIAIEVTLKLKLLKAAGCDEIQPEMLRALSRGGIL